MKWMWVFIAILIILAVYMRFFQYQKPIQTAQINPTVTTTNTPTQDKNSASEDFPQVSIVDQNLDTPWALAFLPDGNFLVTERPGRVRTVDPKTGKDTLVATLTQVKEIGEGGLLGIAIHPQFSSYHFVYLYYTYSSNGSDTLNRVSRFTYVDNSLKDEKIILDAIPGASNHDGGRIKFGPDGLYITTGDAENPSQAQNLNYLGGKILRITPDGKSPDGGDLIYSYGHRNPQGLAWDSSGNLWETEHGRSSPTGFDEINFIENGKNYGWPLIQGDEAKQGMVTPIKNSGATTTWAPSGASFVGKSLFFAGLRGQTLYEAVIEGKTIVNFKEHFSGQFGRLREVVLGPDGMLYVTTSNQDGRGNPQKGDDKILRINPNKL